VERAFRSSGIIVRGAGRWKEEEEEEEEELSLLLP
jgi:hypothetical protein